MDVPVLWLYGADAAGKSTVGWEVYTRLAGSGQAAAYLDIDYLGFCTPQPGGDPTWLVERNLAAMWATFAEAGARCLVAAGVVVSRQQWQRYAAAIPNAKPVLCRLRVSPQTQAERITRRGVLQAGDGEVTDDVLASLRDYAERSASFAAKLDADDFADLTVDTDGLPIQTVADRVQAGIVSGGWTKLFTRPRGLMEDQWAPQPAEGEAKVITLCGSTRFEAEFAEVNQRLTMEGCVVIGLGMFSLPDLPDYDWTADSSDLKGRLGGVHFQKIRMADEVYIVDPGGYIGESTRREIAYAESLGKPVRYLSRERLAQTGNGPQE